MTLQAVLRLQAVLLVYSTVDTGTRHSQQAFFHTGVVRVWRVFDI